jgi:hypothetical protein
MTSAYEITTARNFQGVIKTYNYDGFSVLISDKWIEEFSSLIVNELEIIKEVSINLGIKNSMLLSNEIMDDDSVSSRTKVAFALIAPITQSAMRMRAIIRRIPDSEFRRTLVPMLTKIAQAGMQNVHTPAHYQSAFPSVGLIGRMVILAGSISDSIKQRMESEDESKHTFEYSEKIEALSMVRSKVMSKFPSNLMFPGLGGIYMSDETQSFHKRWSQSYFDKVVVGTSYDEGWYSLTAADKHPWFSVNLILSEDSSIPESLSFTQNSTEKLTFEAVWDSMMSIVSFMLKTEVSIEIPTLSNPEESF